MNDIINLLKDGSKSGIEISNMLKTENISTYQIQRQIRILFQKRIIDIDDNLRYKISDLNNPTIEIY